MTNLSYKCIFIYDKDGISVVVPALEGCITCGNSDADAKLMAQDAIKVWCECKINDLHEVPPEDMGLLDLNKWVKEHKLFLGKKKWRVKNIETKLEE